MLQGQVLKNFIDNQGKSKISIAKDLGMSKQNLFTLFTSRELSEETKKKFENYFGQKIFTQSVLSQQVNIDQARAKEPLETAIENLSISKVIDSKNIERLITLLELKLSSHTRFEPDGLSLPPEGTKGTVTLTPKKKQN